MHSSPKNRVITRLEGDPYAVRARGRELESLGEKMQRAADALRLIAEGSPGEDHSRDALQECAADVHADLRASGTHYSEGGAAIRQYGEAVIEIKPVLNSAVSRAEGAWGDYVLAERSADRDADAVWNARRRFESTDPLTADADHDRAIEEAQEAAKASAATKQQRYEAWLVHAQTFDAEVDSWKTAYDTAVDRLIDANERALRDDVWDDALPLIDVLVTVLEWAAVAVLVAAVIAGGAVVGVLAAVGGIVAFIGTLIRAAMGRRDTSDVVLAALGIVPFGALAQIGRLGDVAADGARFPRLSGRRGTERVASMRRHASAVESIAERARSTGAPFADLGRERSPERVGGVSDPRPGLGDVTTVRGYIESVKHVLGAVNFTGRATADAERGVLVDSWR